MLDDRMSADSHPSLAPPEDGLERSGLTRRITNVVVQAIMGSRAGLRIDRTRLLQVVEDRLPDLLDGTRLCFDPVLKALLRVDGVTESDLYLGVVNLSVQLAHMGIELEPPQLTLDHATRLALLEEARSEASLARRVEHEEEVRRRIRRLRTRKLGDLLVEEGLITGAQLAEALDAQKRLGGRIGTNLVERGHLSEIELAHFLSVQLGVPSVTRLEQIAPDARRIVPEQVAGKHRVVPARVDEQEVHLAMADPLDIEAIDAVVEATGRRVFPVVAPELLISYALERFYGIRRSPRVLAARRTGLRRAPEDGEAGTAPSEPLAAEPEETLDLPALGARLAWVETDAEVLELVQSFLEQRSSTSAIFVVENDNIRGFSLRGGHVTLQRFRDVRFGLEGHPVLEAIAAAHEPYLCSSTDAEMAWLAGVLGPSPAGYVLALPLRRASTLVGLAVAEVMGEGAPDLDRRVVDMAEAALRVVDLRHQILRGAG